MLFADSCFDVSTLHESSWWKPDWVEIKVEIEVEVEVEVVG